MAESMAVKGTAFESVVADIERLIEAGTLSRDRVEAVLEPSELKQLEAKVQPAGWYPIGMFGRLTQILLEVEGRGDVTYLIERGRRAGERIARMGIYDQTSARRDTWGTALGRIMLSLGPLMYRGSRWSYQQAAPDEDEGEAFEITVEVSADFPDVCRHSTQGFIDFMAESGGGGTYTVSSERASRTHIVFHARAVAAR